MEVILQENYPVLGYVGDRVKVRRGFARNYLIPRGIAVEASPFNERLLKHKLSVIQGKKLKLKSEAEEYAKKLESVTLEFHLRGAQQGKSFGIITARDLETEMVNQGFQISRKQIKLLDPLKKAGEYKVPIKLHSEVQASITVKVISDLKDTKPERKKKGRGERGAKGSKLSKGKNQEEKAEDTESPAASATASGEESSAETSEENREQENDKEIEETEQ